MRRSRTIRRAAYIFWRDTLKFFVLAVSMIVLGSAPAFASSCSSWKSTCEGRGGGSYCDAQFSKCMKSGKWTEGAKFGGATHSGLEKK